jgi:surface protein
MKKLFTLFCLLALATVSYATSIVYDFEDSTNPFTDNIRIKSDIEYDETLASNVLGWTCSGHAQNGYSFSYFDFSDQLNHPGKVTVEFDYYNKSGGRSILTIGDASVRGTTGGSSKTTYNKTGAIFRIGSDKNNAFINDTQYEQGNLCDKWLHIVVTANLDAKTVEWVVTDKESTEISSGSDAFYADDALSCTQIDVFGYINNSHCCMMDNLTITEYKSDAQYATYTIKYVDAYDNELKPSRSDEGKVGSYVTLPQSDKVSFYNDDRSMKYIYTSDNTATEVIAAEGTVIKVVFREAEIWNAKLVCMIEGKSGEEGTLAELVTTFFEDDEQTVYPVRGYEKDGKYYFTPATAYNGAPYTFPGSLSPTVIDGKTYFIGYLYYEEDASVAYYSDFERLALPVEDEGEGTGLGQLFGSVNSWWSFTRGYFDRFSGGRAIRLNSDSYVWTEPIAKDGNYRVIIYGRNDKSSVANKPYELGLRDSEGNITMLDDLTIPAWGSAATGQSVVEDVNIPAGFSLVIKNPGEAEMISLDDIKLFKEKEVYTEFVEATGTLTYYYDLQRNSRSGVTEVYDPVNNPDAVRFTGYYKKVLKAVIDPSMKDAPLTSMYSMFFGGFHPETFAFQALWKMTEIKGMENLNTADVTRMDFMFEACNALKTVDVNSFDISKVTKMDFMFGDCYELTTIYCSKDWSSTSASSDNMFGTCRKLVGGNGTAFDSNVTNATYARPDGGTESPGYFTAGVVGDVNGDKVVNFTDAQSILTLMANENYESSADVNNDDAVNFTDYQSILTIMAQ